MTAEELWTDFAEKCNIGDCEYSAWAFGGDSDLLAHLVLAGEKTAAASAYPLYEAENEDLPKAGEYSIVLDSKDNAVCVIRTTKVSVIPFMDVTPEHAFKEGEKDKSLAFWRNVHKSFFSEGLAEAGMEFTADMKVVCEEFEVVYSR